MSAAEMDADSARAALGRVMELLAEWQADKAVFSPDSRFTLNICIDELSRALQGEDAS